MLIFHFFIPPTFWFIIFLSISELYFKERAQDIVSLVEIMYKSPGFIRDYTWNIDRMGIE